MGFRSKPFPTRRVWRFRLSSKTLPKMMAYANGSRYDLNEDEEHLLLSRYIHLSAHWKPTSGLLISKPAPNVRLVYNNKPQQGYPE